MPAARDPPPGTHGITQTYKLKVNMCIATLNINGATTLTHNLNLGGKWAYINNVMRTKRITILALQETHLDNDLLEDINRNYDKSLEIYNSPIPDHKQNSGGVTSILQRALIAPEKIQTHVLWPGRALMIKLSWASLKEITILNIYIPTTRSQHKDFWEHIEQERQRKRLPKPDFILGNFNMMEDAIDREPASENESAATDALRNVRLAWGIQDQWRHDNPNERAFTHHHIREGSYKFVRLDRIYTKRNLANCLFEWKIHEPTVPTDHSLVSVKFAPKDSPLIGKDAGHAQLRQWRMTT